MDQMLLYITCITMVLAISSKPGTCLLGRFVV